MDGLRHTVVVCILFLRSRDDGGDDGSVAVSHHDGSLIVAWWSRQHWPRAAVCCFNLRRCRCEYHDNRVGDRDEAGVEYERVTAGGDFSFEPGGW
jgi:hypothetical protein